MDIETLRQLLSYDVDHIDGDCTNDRWANLRDVSHRTNGENQRRAKATNSTGLLGVSKNRRYGYPARITVDGKERWLGRHPTPEAAHEAYLRAKRELHVGCTL